MTNVVVIAWMVISVLFKYAAPPKPVIANISAIILMTKYTDYKRYPLICAPDTRAIRQRKRAIGSM